MNITMQEHIHQNQNPVVSSMHINQSNMQSNIPQTQNIRNNSFECSGDISSNQVSNQVIQRSENMLKHFKNEKIYMTRKRAKEIGIGSSELDIT